MYILGQIATYPPNIFIYGFYALMLVECAICAGFAVFKQGEELSDEKFIIPKVLCLIISVVIAYFVQQRFVPDALYTSNFIWYDHVVLLIVNALGAGIATVIIYGLRHSKDNYSQLIVIFLVVQIIYLYGMSFEELRNSAFCYYEIFYWLGSNIAFMVLKLAEPK